MVAKLVFLVINAPELSIPVWFNGNLPTYLNWVGCQRVAQRIHLKIHIMLLILQFGNSILSKSGNQQPISCFCRFCSLRYRLLWNLYLSFYLLYFSLERRSVVLLWAYVSAQCLDYPLCKTKNCWPSIDAHFHNGVTHMSCSVSDGKAARTSYMSYCHNATLIWATMEDQQSGTLHWHSFPGWGRECVATVFAPNGSQYLIYGCLQPIAG